MIIFRKRISLLSSFPTSCTGRMWLLWSWAAGSEIVKKKQFGAECFGLDEPNSNNHLSSAMASSMSLWFQRILLHKILYRSWNWSSESKAFWLLRSWGWKRGEKYPSIAIYSWYLLVSYFLSWVVETEWSRCRLETWTNTSRHRCKTNLMTHVDFQFENTVL